LILFQLSLKKKKCNVAPRVGQLNRGPDAVAIKSMKERVRKHVLNTFFYFCWLLPW